MPVLEMYHSESDYRVSWQVDNKDIIEILASDFDNVDEVMKKYADFAAF